VSGRARPGRYRSPYVHGYRSLSPTPILWALAAVAVFAVLFVAALTVQAHRDSHTVAPGPAMAPSTVAPQPATPAPTCFPLQTTPC
jgi:hypothetical protein